MGYFWKWSELMSGILASLVVGIRVEYGTPMAGGYFAGYFSATANGIATHKLIISPKAYELNSSNAGNVADMKAGATSVYDGLSNTNIMVAARTGSFNYPAAEYCRGLNIGGYTDWYLPSYYEMDIVYFSLKPSTQLNSTTPGTGGVKYGTPYAPFANLYSPFVGGNNPYSVPSRSGIYYSAGSPSRTSSLPFQSTSGAQFFLPGVAYRTSTQGIDTLNRGMIFSKIMTNGTTNLFFHQVTSGYTTRAIRKEPV